MVTSNTFLRDDGQFVGASLGGPRVVLTIATTYYVATNGNDANDGLTPSTPWATFAHALAVITGQIDFGGQAVTLQAVAGHAAFTTSLSVTQWTGGGAFIFDGGGGSITNSGTPTLPAVHTSGLIPNFTIQNVTLSAPGNTAFFAQGIGSHTIGSGVIFGVCNIGLYAQGTGVYVAVAAQMQFTGDIVSFALLSNLQATITNNASGRQSIIGARTFGWFAYVSRAAVLQFGGQSFDNGTPGTPPTVTGNRFNVDTNGVIFTAGGGPNYFPGTVAGTQSAGGQYA